MPIKNEHYLDVDLKLENYISLPRVTRNDDVFFIVRILDDGRPVSLDNVQTALLASLRPDKKTILTVGNKLENEITFKIESASLSEPGRVNAAVQLFYTDGRTSTLPFHYEVVPDNSIDYAPSESETSLIQLVLGDAPFIIEAAQSATIGAEDAAAQTLEALDNFDTEKSVAIQELDDVKEENKTNWKQEVATVALRNSTYPNPQIGDTVRITGEARIDRFNGTEWVTTDRYNPAAVDELTVKLAEEAQKVEALKTEKVSMKLLNQLKASMGSVPYGVIKLPSDFIKPGFNLWRDANGVVQHDYNFEQFKTGGTIIYCDPSSAGNDTTGDGSINNPFRSLTKCIDAANAGSDTFYRILCKKSKFNRGYTPQSRTITNKKIAILPDSASGVTQLIFSNHNSGLSWTDQGSGTWRASRSAVYSVYDLRHKDVFGVPIPFAYKSNLDEVKAEEKSWWEDGTYVYVHTLDNLAPNENDIIVNVTQSMFEPTLINSTLYMENTISIGGRSTQDNRVKGDATRATESTFVARNCKFISEAYRLLSGDSNNSLAILDVTKTYLFNCIAAYGGEDGFNYHYQTPNVGNCLVVEVDCIGYKNGHHSTTKTSNSTTAHEAAHVLRVRCIGYEAKGPVLADVNGCKTICIDCHMRDSLDGTATSKAAYQFYNTEGFPTGYAILINCDGGGVDTLSVSASDFDVTLQAFRGTNFLPDFTATVVS